MEALQHVMLGPYPVSDEDIQHYGPANAVYPEPIKFKVPLLMGIKIKDRKEYFVLHDVSDANTELWRMFCMRDGKTRTLENLRRRWGASFNESLMVAIWNETLPWTRWVQANPANLLGFCVFSGVTRCEVDPKWVHLDTSPLGLPTPLSNMLPARIKSLTGEQYMDLEDIRCVHLGVIRARQEADRQECEELAVATQPRNYPKDMKDVNPTGLVIDPKSASRWTFKKVSRDWTAKGFFMFLNHLPTHIQKRRYGIPIVTQVYMERQLPGDVTAVCVGINTPSGEVKVWGRQDLMLGAYEHFRKAGKTETKGGRAALNMQQQLQSIHQRSASPSLLTEEEYQMCIDSTKRAQEKHVVTESEAAKQALENEARKEVMEKYDVGNLPSSDKLDAECKVVMARLSKERKQNKRARPQRS